MFLITLSCFSAGSGVLWREAQHPLYGLAHWPRYVSYSPPSHDWFQNCNVYFILCSCFVLRWIVVFVCWEAFGFRFFCNLDICFIKMWKGMPSQLERLTPFSLTAVIFTLQFTSLLPTWRTSAMLLKQMLKCAAFFATPPPPFFSLWIQIWTWKLSSFF